MLVKNHLQFHHSYRWYKPFPDMDGLWHFSNINHPLITITKLILYLYFFILYGGFPLWNLDPQMIQKAPTRKQKADKSDFGERFLTASDRPDASPQE